MHLCILITGLNVSWTACIIWSCACQRGPSRGWSASGSSSHKVYTSLLERLVYAYYCFFYKVYYNTLDIFLRWILIRVWSGHSLEGSAPFLRVLLNSLSVRSFSEKIMKLSDIFLIVHPTFSERGVWRCWSTCWLSLRNMAFFVPYVILWGYPLLIPDCLIIWLLVWRCYLLEALACP